MIMIMMIIRIRIRIRIKIITNMLMPVKLNSFTHLSILVQATIIPGHYSSN
jgi:hypothetical protein